MFKAQASDMSQPPPPPYGAPRGPPMNGMPPQQPFQQQPPPPRPSGPAPGYPASSQHYQSPYQQSPQQQQPPPHQQQPLGPGTYGRPQPLGPRSAAVGGPQNAAPPRPGPGAPYTMMQPPRGGPPLPHMPPPSPGPAAAGGMLKGPPAVPPSHGLQQAQYQPSKGPVGPPKVPGTPPPVYGQSMPPPPPARGPHGLAPPSSSPRLSAPGGPPPPMRPHSAVQGMGRGPPMPPSPLSQPTTHAPQPPPPRPAASFYKDPGTGPLPGRGVPPPPMSAGGPSPVMNMMQPPQQQQQAPPQHPPPPPGGGPGVQQLTGQFSQMGLRPPHQPPPPPTHPPSPYSQPSHAQQHPDLAGPQGGSGPAGYPGHYRPPSMDYTGAPHPQGMGPSPVPGMEAANQLPMLSEVDLSIASDPRFMRFTVSKIPNSQNNAAATKLPLGVVIQPMALDASGQDSIDVVNFGATGIVRCKKCRTYINPFVSWHDAGRRWRCNVCGTLNDVSSSYFNHLDEHGQRRDKHERPELSNGSVELVAPGEYMVRPPQPPVYLFVVDVSYSSVASGLLARTVETIKKNLDALPGDPRTQFGLVTFDSTVHFYHFKPSLKMPQVLVVPDISELFLPLPEDMLVNLKESREVIDLLLESLPEMYEKTRNMDSALGPALTGAYRVMAPVGGKMCVVLASMPTLGDGRLKPREELRALGTEREHAMLNPEESWYRTKAVEFSRVQISVDLFCVAPAGQQTPFMDLASLTALSKFTGGNLFYYPGFAMEKDGRKLEEEMGGILTRPTGFEAVMRVRATRGLKVTQFYGNYYIRGTDLLALPNCSSESVFGVEMAHDEAFLTASVICVQAALLHTTSSGERRIRVHTVAAPVTAVLQEVIASVDVDTLCNLMAKRMLEVALKTGLDAARHRLTQLCADLLRSCRAFSAHQPQGRASGYHQQQQQQPAGIPSTLELLPLYTMAMTKNVAFRGGTDIRPDLRTYMMQLFSVMNVATSRAFIHPNLFALHTMGNEAGLPVPPSKDSSTDEAPTAGRQKIRLPVAVNLSGERFVSEGIYLLENGISLYLWVGARADPRQLAALFGGMTSVEGADGGVLAQLFEEGKEEGDYARRVHAIVQALREERSLRWLQVQVVKEGDAGLEASSLYRNLVEDRAAFSGGQYNYAEFMGMVSRGGGGGMPGGMGGGAQGVVGGMGGGPPPGMGYPPPSSVMR